MQEKVGPSNGWPIRAAIRRWVPWVGLPLGLLLVADSAGKLLAAQRPVTIGFIARMLVVVAIACITTVVSGLVLHSLGVPGSIGDGEQGNG